jgi:hypothetical protein
MSPYIDLALERVHARARRAPELALRVPVSIETMASHHRRA